MMNAWFSKLWFQFTHLIQGATKIIPVVFGSIKNFNSRTSYKVRPAKRDVTDYSPDISIHAPHTRCDFNLGDWVGFPVYFNSRTSYKVRHAWPSQLRYNVDFNSRTSYKVRHSLWITLPFLSVISIHAPHTRCDLAPLESFIASSIFQFTHLIQGATCGNWCFGCSILYFNSRTSYKVRRPKKYNPLECYIISIHAPHTRCDAGLRQVAGIRLISIHAPHTRCDARLVGACWRPRISIHAPHTRCDRKLLQPSLGQQRFQFTHLIQGATSKLLKTLLTPLLFQFTHLIQGATGAQRLPPLGSRFQFTHLIQGATKN